MELENNISKNDYKINSLFTDPGPDPNPLPSPEIPPAPSSPEESADGESKKD